MSSYFNACFSFQSFSTYLSPIVHFTRFINNETLLNSQPEILNPPRPTARLCRSRLPIHLYPNPYHVHHITDTVYITLHLLPPVGSPGFCDFSISAIICSNAFPTLVFNRALASVKLQLNSSANFLPSSACTWRWSAFRSLLFPTMTNGTQSAPCQQVRQMCGSSGGLRARIMLAR